jgi:DNA polymerase-3 subunit epsilon
MNFIAIDFETANSNRYSPCEIGLVKVEDFKIVEQKSFLIKPKDNYFDYYNTLLHGIDESMH